MDEGDEEAEPSASVRQLSSQVDDIREICDSCEGDIYRSVRCFALLPLYSYAKLTDSLQGSP